MSKETVVEIVYLPISEIHEYGNNPRDNEKAVDAVARSIKKFGVRSPAIVDKDNVLIAGHTRIKAAKQLGMTEFPCVRADDLTKNEAKAFRLADNRMQEDSQWDTEALAQEFAQLKNNGFDLTETGFDEFEIGGIDLSTVDFNATEDYDTPEVESGEEYDESGEAADPEEDSEFVCIFACKDEDEKQVVAELIGETGELKRHYTVEEIRRKLEEAQDEGGDQEDTEAW